MAKPMHHNKSKMNQLHNLNNITCPICGKTRDKNNEFNNDHVIGRNFIPKGYLSNQWNLGLQCCKICNSYKGELEHIISAITMQQNTLGVYSEQDEKLIEHANRKKNVKNKFTNQKVSDKSKIIINHKCDFLEMKITMIGSSPYIKKQFYELAEFQLAEFFYFITYDKQNKIGHYWIGDFYPIVCVFKLDWGNINLIWIDDITSNWNNLFYLITARGFYKTWIRRRVGNPAVWAWAMEWNKNCRLAGFFGDIDEIKNICKNMPIIKPDFTTNEYVSFQETILNENDDILFRKPYPPA